MFTCRQRRRTNAIIDTVRVANIPNIRQYRIDGNPHYRESAKVPDYKLRQVKNYLMLNDAVTNNKQGIAKPTMKVNPILKGDEMVSIKMAKVLDREHYIQRKR